MTPKHQEIIDATLLAVEERARLLHLDLTVPPEEPLRKRSIEQLRASLFGQKLCWIAEYVEGYPAVFQPERREQPGGWHSVEVIGGMRREVYEVCSTVYGSTLSERWSFPPKCQHTQLGALLHAALLQFYREHYPSKHLMSVAEAAKKIGIGRQTLHEWMSTEGVRWIYEAERDAIWLDRDEVSRLWHKKRGLRDYQEPEI